MKRILSAFAVAASIAGLALGTASTAAASEKALPPQPGIFISEVATRGTGPFAQFQEYIEIANRSFTPKFIGGLKVKATFGQGIERQLVTIPLGTVLQPNEVYTIGHIRFTGCVPNQVFQTNLAGHRVVTVELVTQAEAKVDVASIAQHPPRLSRHRVAFGSSPTDFGLGPRTPCIPDEMSQPGQ